VLQLIEDRAVFKSKTDENISFSKEVIVLPFQLDNFSLCSSYSSEHDTGEILESNISAKISSLDLYELSIKDLYELSKELDSEESFLEIEQELESEIKILNEQSGMVRFKTDSSLFGASIVLADGQNKTRVSHTWNAFLSILTLHVVVNENIFSLLREAIINNSLQNVFIEIGIPAFNLRTKLGLGYSGIALSNNQQATINSLSFQHGHTRP